MKLQPLKEFAENPELELQWKPIEEFIVYNSEQQRFRIVVESGTSPKYNFLGPWRSEKLGEEDVNSACDDAKEFSNALVDGPFNYLSPHEIKHLVNAMNRYLNEWQDQRAKMFKQYPKEFGSAPPTPLTDFCND